MTDLSDYLVPSEEGTATLGTSIDDLFNQHNITTASALTLILQTPFTNGLAPTLPEAQALAAEHATTFRNGWGYGVTSTFLSGLTSMSEFMIALTSGGMASTADSLDVMDPKDDGYADQLSGFRAEINAIISTCTDLDEDSGSNLARMKDMHDQLAALALQIDDDDVRLTTAMAVVSDQGTITDLKDEQAGLQRQLAEVNETIAKGATTQIGNDVAFGFEFGSEFVEGMSVGAVAGAAVAVYGVGKEIDKFNEENQELTDQQDSLGDQIAALSTTISEDEVDMMTLTLTAAQITVFNTQIQAMVATTAGIVDQMTDWRRQLESLSDKSSPPTPNFFGDQVSAGLAYWTDLNASMTLYGSIMAQSVTKPNAS